MVSLVGCVAGEGVGRLGQLVVASQLQKSRPVWGQVPATGQCLAQSGSACPQEGLGHALVRFCVSVTRVPDKDNLEDLGSWGQRSQSTDSHVHCSGPQAAREQEREKGPWEEAPASPPAPGPCPPACLRVCLFRWARATEATALPAQSLSLWMSLHRHGAVGTPVDCHEAHVGRALCLAVASARACGPAAVPTTSSRTPSPSSLKLPPRHCPLQPSPPPPPCLVEPCGPPAGACGVCPWADVGSGTQWPRAVPLQSGGPAALHG